MTHGETGSGPLELDFTLVVEAEAPVGTDQDDLEDLSRFTLKAEGANGRWEVTVALVDDDRLRSLHRHFLGIDTVTDIMTFPVDEEDIGARGGELVISVDHARTQGKAWGLAPADEIRFLVTHGLLHLLGWRDDRDQARERMLNRQQNLLDLWRAES